MLLGVVGLAVLTPLVYSGSAALLKHTFTHLGVTLICAAWLLKVTVVGTRINVRQQLFLPLMALFLVSVVSLVNATNLEAGLRDVYRLSIYILLYFMVVEILTDQDRWQLIAGCMVLGGVLTCLVGFYQFIYPESFAFWSVGGNFIALIGNRIYVGAYLLTLIPLAITLYLLGKTRIQRVTWGIAIALLNVGIVLTRSRAAWLGLASGLCLMVFLIYRHQVLQAALCKAGQAKHIFVVLAILVSSWGMGCLLFTRGAPAPSQTSLFAASLDTGSLQARVRFWRESLNMIRANPLLGVGAGNFTFVFLRYADFPQQPVIQNKLLEHPHNEYVNLAAELGVLGLLTFAWLLFRIARTGRQALHQAATGGEALRLWGLLACLASVAINGFFFYPLHEPSSTLNVFLLLALLAGTDQQRLNKRGADPATLPASWTPVRRGAMYLIVCGAFMVLFYTFAFKPCLANYYFSRGVRRYAQGKYEDGIRLVQRSLSWDRHAFLPRFLLAQYDFQTGRFNEAIAESEKLLQLHPYIPYPFDLIAMSDIAQGQMDQAMTTYAKALKVNPRLTTALVGLGSLYAQAKQYDKANTLFERAISVSPEQPHAYLQLGFLQRELGHPEAALTFLRQAVRLDPSLAPAWYAIAGLEAQADRPPAALRSLARAFSLNTALRAQARTDAAFDPIRQHERFRRIVGR